MIGFGKALVLGAIVSLAACGGDDDDSGIDAGEGAVDSGVDGAVATIQPSTGQTISGSAVFSVQGTQVTVAVTVQELPEGIHGVHIHQNGDCGMDGMSAGDHWNPEDADHGMPGSDPSHRGDLGNMTVATDGTGTLSFSTSEWTIGDGGDTDVIGHAIIVHADPDDFGQPLGNAGARIGCGVIQAQ